MHAYNILSSGKCYRFTSKHVSPRLSDDELEQIQTDTSLLSAENLSVRVRPAAREIVATYTLEEFSIELLIVLPTNYPVGVTSVECSKKLGVATSEWRKWMLQLTTFLTYQVFFVCTIHEYHDMITAPSMQSEVVSTMLMLHSSSM